MDAVVIAIVAFAISVSMAKLFAKRNNYEIDANQVRLAFNLLYNNTFRLPFRQLALPYLIR